MRPMVRRSGEPATVRLDACGSLDDRAFRLQHFPERRSQRRAQAFARHLDDVQIGPAGRQLEEGVDPTVNLLDLPRRIDHHGRRPEALGQIAAQRIREVERRASCREPAARGGRRGRRSLGPAHRRPGAGGVAAPEHPPARVERTEELLGAADALARAEEQEAAGVEAVVEDGKQVLLRARKQIDEEVAAGDQIHARERRIVQHVLNGEHDGVAQRLLRPEVAVLLHEEALEAVGADVRRDAFRIASRAGGLDRDRVEIRREDLELEVLAELLERLEQDDGERVRLLARRAAGDPDAQHRAGGPRARRGPRARSEAATGRPRRPGRTRSRRSASPARARRSPRRSLPGSARSRRGVRCDAGPSCDGCAGATSRACRRRSRGRRARGSGPRSAPSRSTRPRSSRCCAPARRRFERERADAAGISSTASTKSAACAAIALSRHALELGRLGRLHQGEPAFRADRREAERAVRPGAGEHDADAATRLDRGRARERRSRSGGAGGRARRPARCRALRRGSPRCGRAARRRRGSARLSSGLRSRRRASRWTSRGSRGAGSCRSEPDGSPPRTPCCSRRGARRRARGEVRAHPPSRRLRRSRLRDRTRPRARCGVCDRDQAEFAGAADRARLSSSSPAHASGVGAL